MNTRLEEIIDSGMQKNLSTIQAQGLDVGILKEAFNDALLKNPKLDSCNEDSIRDAVRRSIMAGLLPDGEEAMISRKQVQNEKGEWIWAMQFQVMAEGLKKVVYDSTKAEIHSGVIYECDEFDFVDTPEGKRVKHAKNLKRSKEDELIGAYCEVKCPGDQEWTLVVVDSLEIDRARSVSPQWMYQMNKSFKSEEIREKSLMSTAWGKYPDRMAEKTAVKLICKRIKYKIPRLAALVSSIDEHEDSAMTDYRENEERPRPRPEPETNPPDNEENRRDPASLEREKSEKEPPPPPPPPKPTGRTARAPAQAAADRREPEPTPEETKSPDETQTERDQLWGNDDDNLL